MNYDAEAQIARELMKFADERPALSRLQAGDVVGGRATALAEAEVEYQTTERHDLGEVSGEVP
jgi:hypothetical protein